MATAAVTEQRDIVIGLCDLLELVLQHAPLVAGHLHRPGGWPSRWQEVGFKSYVVLCPAQLS
jgi:hypothetical protein